MIGVDVEWAHHEARSVDLVAIMDERHELGLGETGVRFVQSLIDPWIEFEGTHGRWFAHLINNPIHGIDTDKLDYLKRDNHQFGLSMTIDIHRIIDNCRVIDNELSFCDRVQDELWNLFLIRHRLHATIYRHPRIMKFEKELQCMLINMEDRERFREAIRRKDVDAFLRWTDAYILIHADPIRRSEYDTRTSMLTPCKEFCQYRDEQFRHLVNVWFYRRSDPTRRFHLKFPSPHCPFSIPI